jgi:hypothetical protein
LLLFFDSPVFIVFLPAVRGMSSRSHTPGCAFGLLRGYPDWTPSGVIRKKDNKMKY